MSVFIKTLQQKKGKMSVNTDLGAIINLAVQFFVVIFWLFPHENIPCQVELKKLARNLERAVTTPLPQKKKKKKSEIRL